MPSQRDAELHCGILDTAAALDAPVAGILGKLTSVRPVLGTNLKRFAILSARAPRSAFPQAPVVDLHMGLRMFSITAQRSSPEWNVLTIMQ